MLCKFLNTEAAVSLAKLPMQIKGFGLVKKSNYKSAMLRRNELLRLIEEERSKAFPLEKTDSSPDTKTSKLHEYG